MIYMVGENVFTFNSGTEFSQMQRLKAFKRNGIEAKLLVRNYNRFLYRDASRAGLAKDDYINMYDYFQGVVGLERKKQELRLLDSIPLTKYHVVGIDNNLTTIDLLGRTIAKIAVMPETVGLVGSIDYFDRFGNKELTEFWDWRGFKSMEQNYNPDETVAAQKFFDRQGHVVLEIVHMNKNGKLAPTLWKLMNYHGHDYAFDSEDSLFLFFMNEITKTTPGLMISDRRTLDAAVKQVAHATGTIAYIHEGDLFSEGEGKKKVPNHIYDEALDEQKPFNAVFFATREQAKSLSSKWPHLTIKSSPDTFAEVQADNQSEPEHPHLTYIGRLFPDKHIAELIDAFEQVHQARPDAELFLKGYFSDDDYHHEITDKIHKKKLDDAVHLVNYSNDNHDILAKTTVFVSAAKSEAFGMNSLEAMAAGVPVVAYGCLFLKNNLLINDQNGLAVDNMTPSNLGKAALSVLQDEQLYHRLQAGALKTAAQHSEKAFVDEWKSGLSEFL
ncbi:MULTISPECIES: glycosyltransferase [Lacticaseibacillus]|uniref:Glycosyltransferase n=1 Tax=Lacticaseibacillus casei DSM 20011 = JCM 1134 = ATCC 393 TaxID=1423732 RepID=A0AAD1ETC4_LACCA|nr:glycosyltransferase [Lacticaseibacillus casei]MBI6597992.1 glycosyltransferase [Lacticaseibacillus casei]MBO1481717.1 glycosyltransferase [Lacticaseibacillus casei]MBO2416977.1 glycosyltransferase [Lacticaseibacillus casei]MCK2081343.1 glycosyltransferase [Lacticaseibacillus casei]MDZ5496113.1 glycosyltransferase [Lacticaseibacillus casei]